MFALHDLHHSDSQDNQLADLWHTSRWRCGSAWGALNCGNRTFLHCFHEGRVVSSIRYTPEHCTNIKQFLCGFNIRYVGPFSITRGAASQTMHLLCYPAFSNTQVLIVWVLGYSYFTFSTSKAVMYSNKFAIENLENESFFTLAWYHQGVGNVRCSLTQCVFCRVDALIIRWKI